MDGLSSKILLVVWLLTFVCIYGKHQDFIYSCEVDVIVRRGTVRKAVPQQNLTVTCSVKHCGESLHVTWCKRLDKNTCIQINNTANIDIRQHDNSFKDKLISFLDFKPISESDDGLYRCGIKEYKDALISHMINISVSDRHQGADNSHNNARQHASAVHASPSVIGKKATNLTWVPYICILFGIALMVFLLMATTLLISYGCKGIMTKSQTKRQEMSTHKLPDIPKSTLGLQTDFDYEYFPTASRTSPSLNVSGSLPVETGQEESGDGVHVINHLQSVMSARAQHATTHQDKHPNYSFISFT